VIRKPKFFRRDESDRLERAKRWLAVARAGIERWRLNMFENGHLKISAQECAALTRALRCAIQRRALQFQEELATA
jgi:DNA-binding transcriptional regulator YdaS (Cro superfamily)